MKKLHYGRSICLILTLWASALSTVALSYSYDIGKNLYVEVVPVTQTGKLSHITIAPITDLLSFQSNSLLLHNGIEFGIQERKREELLSQISSNPFHFNLLGKVYGTLKTYPELKGYNTEYERSIHLLKLAFSARMKKNSAYAKVSAKVLKELAPIPMRREASNLVEKIAFFESKKFRSWESFVTSHRTIQRYCFAYHLIAPLLSDEDVQTIDAVFYDRLKLWDDIIFFQPPNNHMTRAGAALGSCALALASNLQRYNQDLRDAKATIVNRYYAKSMKAISIGLGSLSTDGFNLEGAAYGTYADEVLIPFLRYELEALGDSPILKTERFTNYVRFMSVFYNYKVGYQSWKDGSNSQEAYLPLLLTPSLPFAQGIKAVFYNPSIMEGALLKGDDNIVETILFTDPANKVPAVPFKASISDTLFYEISGLTLFEAKNRGRTIPWRILFVGAQPRIASHDHMVGTGDMLIVVENSEASRHPDYAPGGMADSSFLDYTLTSHSNGMGGRNDLYGKDQTQNLLPMATRSMAISGARSKIGKRIENRQLLFARGGEYALVLEWTENPDTRGEHLFRFHANGQPAQHGFKISGQEDLYLRFYPIAFSGSEVWTTGRHSPSHGIEKTHPVLERKMLGQSTQIATIIAPDRGFLKPLFTKQIGHQQALTELPSEGGGDYDLLLTSNKSARLSIEYKFKEYTFEGRAAHLLGASSSSPHSIALFQNRYFSTSRLSIETSKRADLYFDISNTEESQTLHGVIQNDHKDLELKIGRLENPSSYKVMFKGELLKSTIDDEGHLVTKLNGSGELKITNSLRESYLIYPRPYQNPNLESSLYFQERSLLRELNSLNEAEFSRRVKIIMNDPGLRDSLNREILAQSAPILYDQFLKKISYLLGITPSKTDDIMGLLVLFATSGTLYRTENRLTYTLTESKDTGVMLSTQTNWGELKNKSLTLENIFFKYFSPQTTFLIERESPTLSSGGKWEGNSVDIGKTDKLEATTQITDQVEVSATFKAMSIKNSQTGEVDELVSRLLSVRTSKGIYQAIWITSPTNNELSLNLERLQNYLHFGITQKNRGVKIGAGNLFYGINLTSQESLNKRVTQVEGRFTLPVKANVTIPYAIQLADTKLTGGTVGASAFYNGLGFDYRRYQDYNTNLFYSDMPSTTSDKSLLTGNEYGMTILHRDCLMRISRRLVSSSASNSPLWNAMFSLDGVTLQSEIAEDLALYSLSLEIRSEKNRKSKTLLLQTGYDRGVGTHVGLTGSYANTQGGIVAAISSIIGTNFQVNPLFRLGARLNL